MKHDWTGPQNTCNRCRTLRTIATETQECSGWKWPWESADPQDSVRRDRLELMAARAGNRNADWCSVHDRPRARFECAACFEELARAALATGADHSAVSRDLGARLWERAEELDLEARQAANPDYAAVMRDDARLLREAELVVRGAGTDDLQTRYNNLWLELSAAADRIAILEEALAPFAAMARPGDANGEQAAELVVQRGVASDMTVIKNRDWWRARVALGETQ